MSGGGDARAPHIHTSLMLRSGNLVGALLLSFIACRWSYDGGPSGMSSSDMQSGGYQGKACWLPALNPWASPSNAFTLKLQNRLHAALYL